MHKRKRQESERKSGHAFACRKERTRECAPALERGGGRETEREGGKERGRERGEKERQRECAREREDRKERQEKERE